MINVSTDPAVQVGQRLATGFPGLEPSEEFLEAVAKHKIGNVILFAHNIASSSQLKALCTMLTELITKETGIPPLIAIDQEGGMVTRLSDDATNMPGAMAISATGNPEFAYRAGLSTGCELAAMGVNFNLAPVLDINTHPGNPVIGVRSFGDNAKLVETFGIRMMQGLRDGGVAAAGKHFPGHGDTHLDSHLSLPEVSKTQEDLLSEELVPFASAASSGIDAIMTSHILFPMIEKNPVPATMSGQIINGLLRNTLGYTGVVVSDCMEMAAIREYYGTVEGTLAAFDATVDLVFISHTPQLAVKAAQTALERLETGQMNVVMHQESISRLIKLKHDLLNRRKWPDTVVGCPKHRELAKEIRRRSVTLVSPHSISAKIPQLGHSPMFLGSRAYRATNASSMINPSFNFPSYMVQRIGGTALETPINPNPLEIRGVCNQAKNASSIVLATYNGHMNTGQLALGHALGKLGIPLVVIATRNPYDLSSFSSPVCTLAVYEYTPWIFDILVEILKGDIQPQGVLPISLKEAEYAGHAGQIT